MGGGVFGHLRLDGDICRQGELVRQRALQLEHVLLRPGIVASRYGHWVSIDHEYCRAKSN